MIKVRSTGDEVLLREGSSTLIPAAIADYDIIPLKNTTRILDAFIDNQNNSMADKINRFLHFSD
jgi:mannose-6-phosphate isomerase